MSASPAKTLLVIDDSLTCLEHLRGVVEGLGYAFHGVQDAKLALAELKAGRLPEAILIDLYMPGMDAVGFRIDQLANPDWARIPTVVLISNPVTTRLQATIGMPCLRKPVASRDLERALQDARIAAAPTAFPRPKLG